MTGAGRGSCKRRDRGGYGPIHVYCGISVMGVPTWSVMWRREVNSIALQSPVFSVATPLSVTNTLTGMPVRPATSLLVSD